ncbi:hypothetical protein B0H16DRAFT_1730275 [Mycena metata]|uniref:Uncharacterized protein n=1 Tax=Mycena metata TaxID=1033252 RepID=A0AAD7I923_9AGAR|nr:hypothetical protein B0H16DRAFT_1730275 [Mycena metata]
MNRQNAPSRAQASNNHNTAGWNSSVPYGQGAPHGDPFQPSIQVPAGGPVYHDARMLGHGLPSGLQNTSRSASLDTPRALGRGRSDLTSRSTSLNTFGNIDPNLYENSSSLQTPTQSNRFRVQSRLPPPQFVIPEERTQMDGVVEMLQRILQTTAELNERVTGIEGILSHLQTAAAPPPSRGLAAQRGGLVTRSRAAATRPAHSATARGSDESDVAPSTTDTGTDTETDAEDLAGDLAKAERRALQGYVTKTFRRVCNVRGRNWPNPDVVRSNLITGEVYPTPIFRANVTDHHNQAIFQEVGRQVLQELKDRDVWPAALRRPRGVPDPTWDLALLTNLGKESFRSFKKQWSENQEIEKAIRAEASRGINRRLKRRQRKSSTLAKILDAFAAAYGLDPMFLADLIEQEFLSDEASGPEDESIESKEVWKVRMAAAADLPLAPDAQKGMKILEVLTPAWRSESYSNIIHDMIRFSLDGGTSAQDSDASAGDSSAQELTLQYHRVGVGRSSDRIPRYAPYDFGISAQWWKENGKLPANKKLLKDWMKYPEPDGCGLVVARDARGAVVNVSYATNTDTQTVDDHET